MHMVGPGNKNFASDFDYPSYAVDVRADVPQQVIDRYNEAYVVDGMEFNSLKYTIANFGKINLLRGRRVVEFALKYYF